MTTDQILESINAWQNPYMVTHEVQYNDLIVEIPSKDIVAFAQALKNDAVLEMHFLTDLTAVHYPQMSGRELCVVYHFMSLTQNTRLRVKAYLAINEPEIDSLTPIYAAANWMERETFDFFGVIFKGHPDLRRILNIDEMDYHPMRKEYRLEDESRTDKVDTFFGRDGNTKQEF